MAVNDNPGVSGRTFGIATVVLAVGLGAVIWFVLPGIDAK